MLGELYYPKGRAKETAQQILEVKNPMAINMALGCENDCRYCFGPWAFFKRNWTEMRLPRQNPLNLVIEQKVQPEGVFLSFATDPFLRKNRENTLQLLAFFMARNIPTATLSKIDVPNIRRNRNGMTIISTERRFNLQFEPNAPSSHDRIRKLKARHDQREYTWVSIEPFPCPEIWEQNLIELLEKLRFVDFMIFGKWNYNKLVNTRAAHKFYKEKEIEFKEFCEAQKIRYWVKGNTGLRTRRQQ